MLGGRGSDLCAIARSGRRRERRSGERRSARRERLLPEPGTERRLAVRAAPSAVDALPRAGALRSKDILPPYAQVSQANGRRGRVLKLQYRVYDDSGKASAFLQVIAASGHAVATFRIPLRSFPFQVPVSVEWKVPRTVKPGQLKLCLAATDPSGNRSKRACVSILVT
jgi:hypothetical protein